MKKGTTMAEPIHDKIKQSLTPFDWSRHAAQRGLHEQKTGKIIPNLKRTG